ncbi:hypothetical protein DSO57_1029195 [Entomophthora muscae]|uniref:Uncharacterized protein n=1 Tax=Entomophthora muscae TaxID=34485 RepID=A0ACC2T168_9FUNG|nr:hypothetical protein DSO57_1029195 [Entomophthora muscae]
MGPHPTSKPVHTPASDLLLDNNNKLFGIVYITLSGLAPSSGCVRDSSSDYNNLVLINHDVYPQQIKWTLDNDQNRDTISLTKDQDNIQTLNLSGNINVEVSEDFGFKLPNYKGSIHLTFAFAPDSKLIKVSISNNITYCSAFDW